MKVESLKIMKVFQNGGDIHYILPRFQREYAWDKTDWRTLLEDVKSIYEIYDERREPEHFMGALVVINDGNRSGTIPAFKLVDGQQRLTTVSLALCALADIVKESDPTIYRKARSLLVNEYEDGLIHYKLLPTEKYDDRETYIRIIDGRHDDELLAQSRSRILEAYRYFLKQLELWIKRNRMMPRQVFQVLVNSLQVVFIDLDKQERPFEIFESLNAKGKPLTQPDLVRNYIAMVLPEDQQGSAFADWEAIENMLRESRTVSRIGELTAFLRHYLAYRTGLLPNKGHVYARFRERVLRDVGMDEEKFAEEVRLLRYFAVAYDRFLRPDQEPDDDIRAALYRLQAVESVTAYPFMLGVFDAYRVGEISKQDLLTGLAIIENYLIRRFLANEPTNYTNKMFPTLSRDVSAGDFAPSLMDALVRRNYPGDRQIQRVLPTLPIYANLRRERLVFVLNEINRRITQGTDGYTQLDSAATVEHIMPRSLTDDWKTTLGDNWDKTYRELLDTIGNLTLVTQTWNSSASNAPWRVKRDRLARHALAINRGYFDPGPAQWNEDAIQARAEWLVGLVLEVWPAIGEAPIVDSYTGSKPAAIVIQGEVREVKTWREVLLETMRVAIETVDDFDEFATSLQTTYLSTSERPRSTQLPNGWWLYISLSADAIIALCGQIFARLDLDNEWEVELREG